MSDNESELKDKAQSDASNAGGPQPGQIYRHFTGGLYVILCRSIQEGTLEPLVTYQSNSKGTICTRPLKNFMENVLLTHEVNPTDLLPRFKRVEE